MDKEFLQYLKEMESRTSEQFETLATSVKDGFDEAFEGQNKINAKIDTLQQDVSILKSTTVTKDYLDDKNADLGAEIGKRINKAKEKDLKFNKKLISFLKEEKIRAPNKISELENMLG